MLKRLDGLQTLHIDKNFKRHLPGIEKMLNNYFGSKHTLAELLLALEISSIVLISIVRIFGQEITIDVSRKPNFKSEFRVFRRKNRLLARLEL